MADEKITSYTAVTSFAGADLFEIVVDPAGTPANRKIAANVVGSGLALVSGTDANTTLATNSHYVTDMSAWATADRDYTLPTTAVVGDRIRVSALAGNATYELIVKTGSGQTCAFKGASIAAATEITRLFITGETLLFEYVASNSWMCIEDGRVPMQGLLRLTTSATTSTANTFVYATAHSGAWTADTNVGSVCDTATDKITFRRACKANITFAGRTNVTVTDQKYVNFGIEKNATTVMYAPPAVAAVSGLTSTVGGVLHGHSFAAGDYIRFKFRTEEADKGLQGQSTDIYSVHMAATEVL